VWSDGKAVAPVLPAAPPRQSPYELAVGVGKYEEPDPPVGRSDFGRAETVPLRIEPEMGKVGQHVSQAGRPQAGDVFDEHDSRTKPIDNCSEMRPEPPRVLLRFPLARDARGLAGEPAADDGDSLCSASDDVADVGVSGDAGPVLFEDASGARVVVTLPRDGADSAGFETSLKPADASEEGPDPHVTGT